MTSAAATQEPGKPTFPGDLDPYVYSEKFHWLQKWLWFCAGADVGLMTRCPRSEQIKEEGIGGIVMATAFLAFMSGSYAIYTVFEPKNGLALSAAQEQIHWPSVAIAVFLGLIWSMIILNLDRFVVSSTGHGDGTSEISRGEVWLALPRLAMAIIIGLCLAAPLEIKIMKSEIESKLHEVQNAKVEKLNRDTEEKYKVLLAEQEQKKSAAEAKVREIENGLQSRERDIKRQRDKLEDEAGGRAGSGRPGQGADFRIKSKNYEEMKAELEKAVAGSQEEKSQLKAEAKQAAEQIEALQTQKKDERKINEKKANSEDGLLKRIHISHDIGGWAGVLLKLFLIVIEVAPIFFKMMMARGPYLSLVDNQSEIVLAKEGITKDFQIKPGQEATTSHAGERYHAAETISAFKVAQLDGERQLSALALDIHRNLVAQDIKSHPEKYIEPSQRPSGTT